MTRIIIILNLISIFLFVSCEKENSVEETKVVVPKKAYNSYYFDPSVGNDSNLGDSESSPWKSFSNIQKLELAPGDKIFLAAGEIFSESLELSNIHGSDLKPITISTYIKKNNSNDIAFINVINELNGILIVDCSYITLKNISISANPTESNSTTKLNEMRCGVLITSENSINTKNITLDNISVKNIFYEPEGYSRPSEEIYTSNGTENYGWGIRVISSNNMSFIENIVIKNSLIQNVSHTGIKFTGKTNSVIKNIVVENCKVYETGGPGIQMSRVKNVHVFDNTVNKSGSNDDSRKWGRGSGLWTWGSENILIEHNHFLNANGPLDSAGAHIDFNCKDVVLQYNLSANNTGGFVEILGNNYNCAYRYNISVNDGQRINGVNGAKQDGKTLFLSGYVGKNNPKNGPFNNYIYNNTIYLAQGIISNIIFDKTTSGALIANNIFYVDGDFKGLSWAKYELDNVVLKNNLFLRNDNWSDNIRVSDSAPIYGDPQFSILEGTQIKNYTPNNIALIKNKGIEITKIPNDSIGLTIGLEVSNDILGNPINGKPDIGAIEIAN